MQGIKEFALFPPEDEPYLYPVGAAGGAGVAGSRSALPDARNVDLARFPLFARATPWRARVGPGEVSFEREAA